MNNDDLQNETASRRFFLGEMSEDERLEFEENFILDEGLFENLRIIEDELIEQYIGGTLSDSEKTRFESNYLTTKLRRERVEFTRQMLAELKLKDGEATEVKKIAPVAEQPSFFESISAFFKKTGFALGSAFAVLLLFLGSWYFLKSSEQKIDITKSNTPSPQNSFSSTPTVSQNLNIEPANLKANQDNSVLNINSGASNQRSNISNESNKKKTEENNQQKNTSQPIDSVVTTLALFAGGVRSDGKTNELNMPKNSGGAILQLNIENSDYKTYRTEIIDQDGKVVLSSYKLIPQKSKVNVIIPPNKLKRGDYIIKLFGKNALNQDESVADYQFRVNQK